MKFPNDEDLLELNHIIMIKRFPTKGETDIHIENLNYESKKIK